MKQKMKMKENEAIFNDNYCVDHKFMAIACVVRLSTK